MIYEIQEKEEFKVIGIEIKTSNQTPKEIMDHWNKFWKENIIEKIPNKIDNDFLGMYTNYDGDYTKPFSLVICCRVSSLVGIPRGMMGFEIPKQKYAKFIGKGEMPDCVVDTWKEIWDLDLDRAYSYDFEIYSPQVQDEVNIYISLN